jgi:hypothetical protein
VSTVGVQNPVPTINSPTFITIEIRIAHRVVALLLLLRSSSRSSDCRVSALVRVVLWIHYRLQRGYISKGSTVDTL